MMAEEPPQDAPSGGHPTDQSSQAQAPSEQPTSQQLPSSNTLEAEQNAAFSAQNNTHPEQAIPQPAAPQLPSGGSIPAQDTATIQPSPLGSATAPSSTTTHTDEKRDSTMPPTRGNTAQAASNDVAAAVLRGPPGGAPARIFLNEKVVPYLLEGMKSIANEQPQDPLRVLGEFLLQKSKESGEMPSSAPAQGESTNN